MSAKPMYMDIVAKNSLSFEDAGFGFRLDVESSDAEKLGNGVDEASQKVATSWVSFRGSGVKDSRACYRL